MQKIKHNPFQIFFSAILISAAVCFCHYSTAQSGFAKKGNGVGTANCSDIIFSGTPSSITHTMEAKGSAWYRKKIDLNKPFELEMVIDIYQTIFTDGFVFALCEDSTALGGVSNAMGWGGINKSFAVTLDLKSNAADNDPPFAHAAVQINGNTNHNSSDNIAGPVSIQSFFNFSPQLYQYSVFAWDPTGKILSLKIDNITVLSVQYDIVSKIFNGNNFVYWGFTASLSQYTSMSDVPIDSRPLPGYLRAYFGSIIPGYESKPILDTCFGTPIEFSDNSIYESDGTFNSSNLARWYWEFGDGTSSTLRNPPPHQYPGPGKYIFKFTVTNQIGCTIDTLVKIITLASIPKADFTGDNFCSGVPLKFTDKSTATVTNGIVFWTWDFNGEAASNDQNPIVEFSSAGKKDILLKVTTAEGCTADTVKSIILGIKPEIDFSFNKDCERNVQYQGILNNNVALKKWEWDFGNNDFSNTNNPLHRFRVNGNYVSRLYVISSENCSSDTVKKDIVINKIIPNAGNDTIAVKGQPIQLMATGAEKYLWQPAEGLSNPSVPNPIAVLNTSKQYIVDFSNNDGCKATDSIYIKVFNEISIYVPGAFTPNGDGLNDALHFTAPGFKQVYFFKIYNRWGQGLFSASNSKTGWDGKFGGKQLPAGIYVWIIKASDYNGHTQIKKGTVMLIR